MIGTVLKESALASPLQGASVISRYWSYTLALFAGASLAFAFAPHPFWPLAILSPACLLWLWQSASPGMAFKQGYFYGIGVCLLAVSWVYVSIHEFGNTETPLAILILSIFILGFSLYPAFQGFLLKKYFKGTTLQLCLLGFPAYWMLFEWLRSWFLTGFPWLFLGYSQLSTPLSGYAPVLSVYGVSLAVAFTSGALIALILGRRSQKILAGLLLIVIWGGGEILRQISWTQPLAREYSVSLIQGNIPPFDKFTQSNPIDSARQVYGRLTAPLWGKDLILWPESAIAYPLPQAEPFLQEMAATAKARGSVLITGLQTILKDNQYYNSMVAVGDQGQGLYHKRHLLPFGDYLPFENYIRGLVNFFDIPMSSFSPGPAQQALLQAKDLKVAPLICYEIAFPELVRETAALADVIVTLSEDGWFGRSWGPHQHLQIAEMRALETGRYVLRSTTSGISAIINPQGKITETAPQFEATSVSGTFQKMQGQTPWTKFGLAPLMILAILGFILPGRGGKNRSKGFKNPL